MEIKERKIRGIYEIQLKPHFDQRGFFMRTFDDEIFNKAGINCQWVQENHSRSEKRGIIRGLHFQLPPFSETKVIRCIVGAVLDVFVDLRSKSKTFGQWDSIELSAENKKMIYIPRGFAHGFCTLTEKSEIVYKVDNFYSRQMERGILWNDKDLNILWPASNPLLSEKDLHNLTMKQFVEQYKSIKI